jgi:hypothetical protein
MVMSELGPIMYDSSQAIIQGEAYEGNAAQSPLK